MTTLCVCSVLLALYRFSHALCVTIADFALASTLALDGSQDTGTFDQSAGPSLLDQYEYAMYGKLYKWKQACAFQKQLERAARDRVTRIRVPAGPTKGTC